MGHGIIKLLHPAEFMISIVVLTAVLLLAGQPIFVEVVVLI